jgi:hypothetical protein
LMLLCLPPVRTEKLRHENFLTLSQVSIFTFVNEPARRNAPHPLAEVYTAIFGADLPQSVAEPPHCRAAVSSSERRLCDAHPNPKRAGRMHVFLGRRDEHWPGLAWKGVVLAVNCLKAIVSSA